MLLRLFLVLLLEAFLIDLSIVKASHFQALFLLPHFSVLGLDLVFDQIIQSKDVPSIVSFRLDLSFGAGLDTRLREVHLRPT